MTYSVIGILAVIIHIIINADIFFRPGEKGGQFPARSYYCHFLYAVIAYHLSDALWGVLYGRRMVWSAYADTVVYFVLMALSVLLWSEFTFRYLNREGKFAKVLHCVGWLFFAFQIIALALNFFAPIMFSFGESGEYRAGVLRDVALDVQMLMFFLTSVHTLLVSDTLEEGSAKRRHFTIGLFGLSMIIAIAAQIYLPLWPMYSMGYLVGGCALHTFVVQDEKEEYLRALAESVEREAQRQRELGEAKRLAYSDSLTGAKSKHAYAEAEEDVDRRIEAGAISEFASVVFDVNGLKHVNDTLGHEAGNMHIISASDLIGEVFTHSPIFRIGGDEFALILEGQDYENRDALMRAFERRVEQNLQNGQVVVSAGIADFEPGQDNTCNAVFQRADERMYRRKRELKERGSITRD